MENAGLNRAYRLVWSEVHQAFVAVSELASSRGKRSGKAAVVLAAASLFGLAGMGSSAALAQSLPTGGQVVAGSGAMAQTGQTLTITQTSDKMAANWQNFSIGQGHTVNFVQPSASAVALNRVLGADVSVIQGALNANGQVFLVNPNGVLFTPTAQVNVGALAASTLNLSTEDFLAGNYRFSGDSAALIKNEGSITTANGGAVALIAARIENTGSITASQGNVLMGAGSKVRLDLGGPVKIEVEEGALNTLIEQGGAIRAEGGLVYLTAKAAGDLASSAINHTGLTEARTLSTGEKGEIWLMGDMAKGTVQVGGLLDASAAEGGQGGFIETSAHNVKVVDGAQVKAGHWLIDPVDFTIGAGAGGQTTSGIGADTLATSLGAGNVTIQTDGGTTGNGDIFVNEAVSWTSANQLTLSAHRDININADITATNGKVQLEYGQGAPAANNTASYRFSGGRINLKAGNNFLTKLGNDALTTPWKVITDLGSESSVTGTDLQGMNENPSGNYVLGADIDASATSGWNGVAGFMPIGDDTTKFTGSFDGLGHTITGLVINRATDSVGLFGSVNNGTIRNIGLVGGSVKGGNYVGGLVGNISIDSGPASININNSYTTGSVTGVYSVGGLVGNMVIYDDQTSININNSYATGSVIGTNNGAGGLVGFVEAWGGAVSISNSYALGSVKAEVDVGGLVGNMTVDTGGTASISNSYATGSVTGNTSVGGLVGELSGTVSNSFWDIDATGQLTSAGGTGIHSLTGGTINAYTQATYGTESGGVWSGFDFTNTWYMVDGYTRPFLRMEHSTTISNAHQLQLMGMNLGASYTLANNIDLAPALANKSEMWKCTAADCATTFQGSFVPVGQAGKPFTGSFDGLGHTLTGLTINRPATERVGLFGDAQNATIRNIGLVGGSVTGKLAVGGLGGWLRNSTISNSYTTGTVTSEEIVGGLVGILKDGTIINSYATGSVTGTLRASVGGLVGDMNGGVVSNSYATGSVTGASGVGGLAGSLKDGAVSNSFWDMQTTGRDASQGIGEVTGSPTRTNVSGKTTVEMQLPSTFVDAGWDNSTWTFGTGQAAAGYGILRPYLTDVTRVADRATPGTLFDGGMGTSVSAYGVSSWAQLANINHVADGNYSFALKNNLNNVSGGYDIYAASGANSGAGWLPIGNNTKKFKGSFDGQGKTISNLNINRPSTYFVGLFGAAQNATINNVGLVGSSVTGSGYVGGLAGYLNDSTVSNSYTTSSVTGSAWHVGGLVGGTNNGTVSNSYAAGSVTGTNYVGGLVGLFSDGGTVSNSYATGSVTGDYSVGGLVGMLSESTTSISNSYATGNVTASSSVPGGLVGSLDKGTVSNSFWDIQTTGRDASQGFGTIGSGMQTNVSGKNTAEMQQRSTFTGWSDSTWSFGAGQAVEGYGISRPYLTDVTRTADIPAQGGTLFDGGWGGLSNVQQAGADGSAYGVSSWAQLANINYVADSNYSFALKNALSSTPSTGHDTYAAASANGGNGWLPIGTAAKPFKGSFDGKGNTISDLTINRPTTDNVGLFGYAENATISNVGLVNGSVEGMQYTGGLVGMLKNGTISNSYFTGSVTGDNSYVGGLIGYFDITSGSTASISNSYTSAIVVGKNENNGGLVGYIKNTNGAVSVSNSYTTGDVTGAGQVAGLVGVMLGNGGSSSISNSYATGNLDNVSTQSGGLVGVINSNTGNTTTISESYATGNITGSATLSTGFSGGLVGALIAYSNGKVNVNKSYATGNVTMEGTGTAKDIGGLIGSLAAQDTSTVTVSESYATGSVKGKFNIGGLIGNLEKGIVNNSYAAGSVVGATNVGGLVGRASAITATPNTIIISNSYAAGGVTGTTNVGGLLGQFSGSSSASSGTVSDSFWDSDKHPGVGIGNTAGVAPTLSISGKTTAEMQTIATFNTGGPAWDIQEDSSYSGSYLYPRLTMSGSTPVWKIKSATASSAVPYTLTNLTGTYEYKGSDYLLTDLWSSTNIFGSTYSAWILDTDYTFQYADATVTGFTNAGTYNGIGVSILKSGFSVASTGNTNGILTITPKTVTFGTTSKTYDGSDSLAGAVTVNTGITGQALTYTSAAANSANVGAGNYINAITLADGTGGLASNYKLPVTLDATNALVTINAAPLTVTVMTAGNKVYDGSTAATLTGGSLSGVISADSGNVAFTAGTGQFADKNVGTGKTVTVTGTTLSGTAAGNYSVSDPTGLTANITAKALTASYTASNKTYDGTTSASVSGSSSDIVSGDAVTFGQTAAFADKDAGTGKTVSISAIALSGTDASNYALQSTTASATADINAATLSVIANNASKTYDGAVYAGGYGATYSGLVSGEAASAVTTGTLSYSGTSQSAINAGSYDITPGGLTASNSNYTLSFVNGVLTINAVVVTPSGPSTPSTSPIAGSLTGSVSKTYDGTNAATLSADNYLLTGWIGSDGANVTKTSGTYDNANAGSDKAVMVSLARSDYSATGSTNLGNYILPSSISGSVGSITPRPIGVTADAQSKVVGSADPALTYRVTSGSLVGSESLSGALIRAAGESVGNHAINQGTVTDSKNPNYQIAYVGADLSISAAPVVVPPVVEPPVVEPPVVVPPVVEPPPVVVPPVVVPPVVQPPVVVPPVVVPPVVQPPVVEPPPVVVPPVVAPPPVAIPPVVVPPVVDPQAPITLVVQAAASLAAQNQDTKEEPTGNSGLVLVDVPDVPALGQSVSRLSANGFLNVFVVRGGINMGGVESGANANANDDGDDNTSKR